MEAKEAVCQSCMMRKRGGNIWSEAERGIAMKVSLFARRPLAWRTKACSQAQPVRLNETRKVVGTARLLDRAAAFGDVSDWWRLHQRVGLVVTCLRAPLYACAAACWCSVEGRRCEERNGVETTRKRCRDFAASAAPTARRTLLRCQCLAVLVLLAAKKE